MPTHNELADEVLAHSNDLDEWDDEPVKIEARPSGSQVVSARIPTALAEDLFALANRQHCKPSDAIRLALERLVADDLPFTVFQAMGSASPWGQAVTIRGTGMSNVLIENANLVVEPTRLFDNLLLGVAHEWLVAEAPALDVAQEAAETL